MSEWSEKGPFRVRVIQVALTEERSFRESAAPESVHEITWDGRTTPSRLGMVLAWALVAIMLTITYVALRMSEEIPWYASALGWLTFVVVSFGVLTSRLAQMGGSPLRPSRTEEAPVRKLLIDPRELVFEDPSGRRTFPRGRLVVEHREIDGRHCAVLLNDPEELVLYDSHRELEVDWLVAHLKEALAR